MHEPRTDIDKPGPRVSRPLLLLGGLGVVLLIVGLLLPILPFVVYLAVAVVLAVIAFGRAARLMRTRHLASILVGITGVVLAVCVLLVVGFFIWVASTGGFD